MHIGRIPECQKGLRAVEEEIEDLHLRRKPLILQADLLQKKRRVGITLVQVLDLEILRDEIFAIDAKIKDGEANLMVWKRTKARESMGLLFDSLLKCSEKGTVVARLGHAIIENKLIPTETIQPDHPRGHYSNESQVESLVVEAERIVEAERPPNEDRTGAIPNHLPPLHVPSKVSSKPDTSMDGQRGATNTRSQDPHHTKPIDSQRRFRLVDHFRVHSSCSPLLPPRLWGC